MSTRAQAAVERTYSPGDYLFNEGDASHSIFLIRRGTIGIRKLKGSGHIEIARVYSNEVIGELSFFDRLPRSATAVALTEVEALEIPFENLERIYDSVPNYLKTIVAAMADRLRKANDLIHRLEKRSSGESGLEVEAGSRRTEPTLSDVLAMAEEIEKGRQNPISSTGENGDPSSDPDQK